MNSDDASRERSAYLEITVGRYRGALRADCVVEVSSQTPTGQEITLRGRTFTYLDLRTRFGEPAPRAARFVVAVEANGRTGAVGVDAVSHVRREGLELVSMPRFGLEQPALFAGAVRTSTAVLPVFDPGQLVTA